MKTPTLISWSLRVEQEITPDTSLTIGYVGSHGYHEIIGIDANEPFPVICPASPCPATYPLPFPAHWQVHQFLRVAITFLPTKSKPQHRQHLDMVFSGTSNYNALQIDVNRRFRHGFSLRGVYTWSKALDDGDSLNGTAAAMLQG